MKALLGGKGANLAEMSNLGLPVPPGFTISTEVCAWFYAHGKTYPAELKEQVTQALAAIEQELGVRFGDPERPAAGLGALRGAGVDAGNDGHGPQSRPQRPDGRGSGRRPAATPASPGTAIAASSRCMRDVVLEVDHYQFEEALEDAKQAQRLPLRHRPRRRDAWPSWSATYKQIVAKATGKPFPQDPQEQLWGAIGAVFGSWMTPRAVTYRRLNNISQRDGHRGHRAGDGVRQHGRGLRHRRRLHAQSVDRRERVLRRVPDQCPGRGRGGRHPHAAALDPRHGRRQRLGRRSRWRRRCRRRSRSCRPCSSELERHYRDMQDIEFTIQRGKLFILQTRTGKRTGAGGAEDRGRHGGRGADHARGGGAARRSGLARPAAASDARPQGRAQGHRQGPAGLAGRRVRQGRVQRRPCREDGGSRRGRDPGADRDLARRHPRHARRQGHPDLARRHDQPCRRGGARHGQGLRLRCRRRAHLLCREGVHREGRACVGRGRRDHHRRQPRAR